MATEQSLVCITAPAATDLSAKQFYIVKIDASGNCALGAAVTDVVVGVLQNAPGSTFPASIAVLGVTKCIGGAALTIGQAIGSDSGGKGTVVAAVTGGSVYNYVVGYVKTASVAANGLAEVILRPGHIQV